MDFLKVIYENVEKNIDFTSISYLYLYLYSISICVGHRHFEVF